MQKFLLLSLFLVLLLSAAESWALRPCPGTYNPHTWNNCQGTYTFPSGEKYTGQTFLIWQSVGREIRLELFK
jgi:hypothetical protein